MPSARPSAVAMRNSATLVQSVTQVLSMIGLRYCQSAPNTSEGAGRMVSGTFSARQTISQTTKSSTVNTVGETTLIANSRLSTDQAPQLVHYVLEGLRIGDVEIARARQFHFA